MQEDGKVRLKDLLNDGLNGQKEGDTPLLSRSMASLEGKIRVDQETKQIIVEKINSYIDELQADLDGPLFKHKETIYDCISTWKNLGFLGCDLFEILFKQSDDYHQLLHQKRDDAAAGIQGHATLLAQSDDVMERIMTMLRSIPSGSDEVGYRAWCQSFSKYISQTVQANVQAGDVMEEAAKGMAGFAQNVQDLEASIPVFKSHIKRVNMMSLNLCLELAKMDNIDDELFPAHSIASEVKNSMIGLTEQVRLFGEKVDRLSQQAHHRVSDFKTKQSQLLSHKDTLDEDQVADLLHSLEQSLGTCETSLEQLGNVQRDAREHIEDVGHSIDSMAENNGLIPDIEKAAEFMVKKMEAHQQETEELFENYDLQKHRRSEWLEDIIQFVALQSVKDALKQRSCNVKGQLERQEQEGHRKALEIAETEFIS